MIQKRYVADGEQVIKSFIENGGDITISNKENKHLLHLYPKVYNFEQTELFQKICKMLDVNQVDIFGNTPIFYLHFDKLPVSKSDYFAILQGAGADLNLKDQHGKTFTHYTIEKIPINVFTKIWIAKYFNICQKVGISLDIPDCDGKTAIDYALERFQELDSLWFRNQCSVFLDRYAEKYPDSLKEYLASGKASGYNQEFVQKYKILCGLESPAISVESVIQKCGAADETIKDDNISIEIAGEISLEGHEEVPCCSCSIF